ncbi:MAG: tetratricopeptide repeat protein [Gemmatimonadetes bacterium]|nr:tetratricopeptide repeat protein [Gemmatimonadota bacterium]HPF61729.1 tetratricopeptide repeat protein [Gemmatimonadales bacterium]HRX18420.1 tetratricopeptide repeat protein [Gemmatimonadales bacterium]
MSRDSLDAMEREHARIAARLTEPLGTAERLQVKDEIVALFHRAEAALEEVTAFKESIRALIEGFKAMPAATAPAPSVRHDHIGASTSVERGWSALAAGDWSGAEALLRDALARDTHHTDAAALLGWALMHQGRDDEALQRCLQVLVREPEHGLARTAVGAICLRKGITGEAIEHLSRAARAGDRRAALYANYWLGVAFLEREMPADAIEVLERAVRLGPNLAEGWAELGRAQWTLAQNDAARSSWRTGLAIRHSPFAARAAELLRAADAGEELPRSPLA